MKWIRILLLVVLLPFSCQGVSWIRFQGGFNNDGSGGITGLPGGEIVTGTWFSGGITENSQNFVTNGGTDILLSKTDNSGGYLWIKHIGGTGDDRVIAVTHDLSGNIVVGGYFSNTLTVDGNTITSTGSQDAFILKLDASGNTIWLKGFGGIYNDVVNSITCDPNGIVYCTGDYTGNVVIGSATLSSLTVAGGTQPSQDVFTSSWASNGTFRWAKSGGSHYSDQSAGIASDQNGNVYITGQFSDTIQFDIQHPNIISNAIYIVKYSSSGNEMWFNYAGGGSLSRVRGICSDGSNYIYIAGECIGNTQFFGSPALTSNSAFLNRIFITRYDLNGSPLLVKSDGSDSPVSLAGIAMGSNGRIYLSGVFRCRFNEYCNQYGQGTFNSVGFTDVFVSSYDPSLNRLWSRHTGGPDNDEVTGISVAGTDTIPAVAGTFKRRFVYPVSTPTAFLSYGNGSGLAPPDQSGFMNCGDSNYDNYLQGISNGSTDVFFGKITDPTRLPFDYYTRRNSSCIPDMVGVCVSIAASNDLCTDQLTPVCGGISIYAATNTTVSTPGSGLSPGPDFNYLWNTGATGRNTMANASGTYTVTITSADGCFSSTDSMSLIVYQAPSKPTISDSKGINVNAQTVQPINLCAPDSVTLTATNQFPWITGTWTYNSVTTPGPDLTIHFTNVFQGGAQINYITADGCTATNAVPLIVDSGSLATINPFLIIDDSITCTGAYVEISVIDSNTMQPCSIQDVYAISWSFTPTANSNLSCQKVTFLPTVSGNYSVTMSIERRKCGLIDTVSITKNFTVQVGASPVVNGSVTGSPTTRICAGDTVSFMAFGGDRYRWSNGQTTSAISVTIPGQYCVTIFRDSSGCTGSQSICRQVIYLPSPVITGGQGPVILCPNDSTLLYVTSPGTSYNWSGPGITNSFNDSLYVTQPGSYYCNVTDTSGCILNSNSIEVLQYSSPYITASPGTLFCLGDSVRLSANSTGNSTVQWHLPFSGNSMHVYASSGGTYSCSITSCGITTVASVSLIEIQVQAQILQSDTTLCYGDSIKLTLAPFGGTALWLPDSIFANEIFVSQENAYSVTIQDPNGCSAVSNIVNINVDTVHASDSIVTNAPLCEGEMLFLLPDVQNNSSAIWTGPGGFTSTLTHLFLDSVRPSQSGFYVMSAVLGQCISAPDSVEVIIYDSVPNYILSHSALCEGELAIVSASPLPLFNVSWTSPANIINTDTSFIIGNYTSADTGFYLLLVENGTCPSFTDSIHLGLPVSGHISLTASDTLVCDGEIITVNSSSSSGNITWFPAGTGTTASFTASGMIYCVLDDTSGCRFHSDSLQLYFNTPSSIAQMNDQVACSGEMAMLNAVVIPGTSTPDYLWTGPGGYSSNQLDPVLTNISINDSGVYTLTLIDSVCPGISGNLHLMVNVKAAQPVITSIIPDCSGEPLLLSIPEVPGVEVIFIDASGDTVHNHILDYQSALLADTGWFYCFAMVEGCPPSTDSIEVLFDSCRVDAGQWFLPNVFSPNNDGINEVFKPGVPLGEDGLLTIMNRWGKTVFEGKVSIGWDGKNSNDEPQPEGTYFWIISPDSTSTSLDKPNGYLQLVR